MRGIDHHTVVRFAEKASQEFFNRSRRPMRICLVLINCLLIPTLFSQEPPQAATPAPESPYVEREEKQFNFFPGGKIEILIGVPGSVKIVGWQKGSIRVEAEKIIYYETTEKAKAFLKKSPLRVRHNQTTATIRAMTAPEPPAILEVNLYGLRPQRKDGHQRQNGQGRFFHRRRQWLGRSHGQRRQPGSQIGGRIFFRHHSTR